jgi:hypothetical protein
MKHMLPGLERSLAAPVEDAARPLAPLRWAHLQDHLASKVGIVAFGLAQFGYLLLNINRGLILSDEGVSVYGAARLLYGDLPYKDMWMVGYSPGQFYVLAGLFRLFGESVGVERLWDTSVRAAIGLVVYLIARQLATPALALLAWGTSTILLFGRTIYGYTTSPALLLCLAAVLFFIMYVREHRSAWLLVTGATVGTAVLFRHDFGFYALVAIAVVLAFYPGASGPAPARRSAGARGRQVLLFVGAAMMVVAPVVLLILSVVPVPDLWSDLVVTPLTVFTRTRHLPYPPVVPVGTSVSAWLDFYFPWLIGAAGVGSVILARRAASHPADRVAQRIYVYGTAALLLLALTLFAQALSRNDEPHRLPAQIPALLAGIALAPRLLRRVPQRLPRTTLSVLTGTSYGVVVLLPLVAQVTGAARLLSVDCRSYLARAGQICVNPDQRQAVEYIQAHTAPTDPIFVGLSRHDRIFLSDTMFYFLAARPSATRYHALVPGVATTVPVQQEIIHGLERSRVPYVVLFAQYENTVEPNGSTDPGATLLDAFIRQHYRPTVQFGFYTIWKRAD